MVESSYGLTLSWCIVCAIKFNVLYIMLSGHFYRAADSIFARVGRLGFEEVMVQLLKHKCLPILLYALEVCNLDKRILHSLDFTVNISFMKLFKTCNIENSTLLSNLVWL